MPSKFDDFSHRPCVACGKKRTIGVVYGHPPEVKYWCWRCLPDEFRPPKRKGGRQ